MKKFSRIWIPGLVTTILYFMLQMVAHKILKLDLSKVANPQTYITWYYLLLSLFFTSVVITFVNILVYLIRRYKQRKDWMKGHRA